MKEEDKKEGLLKRLKDIEDKNKKQLKIIRNKTDIKSQIDFFDKYLTPEAVALIKEVKSMGDTLFVQIVCETNNCWDKCLRISA